MKIWSENIVVPIIMQIVAWTFFYKHDARLLLYQPEYDIAVLR